MKKNHAFTLIELMVVVAIMAILAIAGLSIFTTAREKAKDARLKSDVESWSQAAEQLFDFSDETYPADLDSNEFENGIRPSEGEIIYEINDSYTSFCICSDPLNDPDTGNCAGCAGDGTCDYSATTNFCKSSAQ